jgi:D-amino-acid dehydrogenase
MQIAIVGAGIVGVATAYELACDGHEVTVYEQRSAAAEEASFGNSGLLAPSLLIPWPHPASAAPCAA